MIRVLVLLALIGAVIGAEAYVYASLAGGEAGAGEAATGTEYVIVVGGGPPSAALVRVNNSGAEVLAGTRLFFAPENATMFDAVVYGNLLAAWTGETGNWLFIYDLLKPSLPQTILHFEKGAVQHAFAMNLMGDKLFVIELNRTTREARLCRVDVDSGVVEKCVGLPLSPPHHVVARDGLVYVSFTRHPNIAVYDSELRLVKMVNLPYIPHMFYIFELGNRRYIIYEGHTPDAVAQYDRGIVPPHPMLIVVTDIEGRLVAQRAVYAPWPGAPGIVVCRGLAFVTAPLAGRVYVFEMPMLRLVDAISGVAPWGAFANSDCSRVYVTDILGRRVIVIDVTTLRYYSVETPMTLPHTVIPVDSDAAKRFAEYLGFAVRFEPRSFEVVELACGERAVEIRLSGGS